MSNKRGLMNIKGFIFTVIILFSLNLIVFLPSVKGDFIWDDRDFILDNLFIQSPSFLKHFLFSPFWISTTNLELGKQFEEQTQFYRPISILSYWMDLNIWGFNPSGFHLTNILLHTINSILFFYIAVGLGFKRIYALLSSILFSLHPFHFENVAWISGRTDLLSFLFAAAATLFFFRFRRNHRRSSLLFSSFFFFLSLLSKENCIFLFVIFFLFLLIDNKSLKYSLISISPYVFFLITWFIIRNVVLTTIPIQFSWETIRNIFSVTGFYTFKSLFPLNLSISINTQDVFPNPIFLLSGLIILIAVFILTVMFTFKRAFKNKVSFAIVAFYLLIFPSVAVLLVPTANSLVAWRFLYAPSAVLIGILFYLLSKWIKSRRVLFPVLICICIIFILELYPKNRFYGQKESDFWVNMKNIKRESLIAQFNSASAILFVNENKALLIYDDILKKRKNHPRYEDYKRMIQENLAAYYASKGELRKAKHYFESVIKMNKISGIEFHFNYASFLCLTGEKSRAKSIVTNLLHTNPNNHNVLFMSSKFYIRIKEYKKAIQLLTKDYQLFNRSESLQLLNVLKKNIPPQNNKNNR